MKTKILTAIAMLLTIVSVAGITIVLPRKLVEALGITEDTLFETYFDGSSIRVRTLDEEEVRSAMIAGLEGAFDD